VKAMVDIQSARPWPSMLATGSSCIICPIFSSVTDDVG
jgi:hypothetical protein